jgi:hypothetical protein
MLPDRHNVAAAAGEGFAVFAIAAAECRKEFRKV